MAAGSWVFMVMFYELRTSSALHTLYAEQTHRVPVLCMWLLMLLRAPVEVLALRQNSMKVSTVTVTPRLNGPLGVYGHAVCDAWLGASHSLVVEPGVQHTPTIMLALRRRVSSVVVNWFWRNQLYQGQTTNNNLCSL